MKKKKRPIIVYVYVCGDILHEGHLLQMENGKALGDKLIVGVLTDKAVMEKKRKPIMEFRERLRLIQSLKCVDCAVPQDEYSPLTNLKAIQPDIHMEDCFPLLSLVLEDAFLQSLENKSHLLLLHHLQ